MGAINQKLQGIIIRRRRQELNWSQTTLCEDICAVSYLSRIEQGKANGSPEVLELLLKRLGIDWQEDPAFCDEASAWFEGWYDRLFAGDKIEGLQTSLAQRREECRYSPFFLDWLLLNWQASGQAPEGMEEFIPAMDSRQRNLYLCLTRQFEELRQSANQSYFLLEVGKNALWRGEYGNAVDCLQKAMEQSYREGSLPVQAECWAYLGSCYSSLNQLEQARKHYATASRMARSLGRQKDVTVIAYNLATTELQMDKPADALRHLLEQPWNEGLYFQKLAVCHELLGQADKACAALDRALTAPFGTAPLGARSNDAARIRQTFEQMCQLIRMRLEDPNYLKDPAYGNLLRTCVRNQKRYLSMGFVNFHTRWLLEWYTANRQYQKAYDALWAIHTGNSV